LYNLQHKAQLWLPNANIPVCELQEQSDFVQMWHEVKSFMLECWPLAAKNIVPKVCEYTKIKWSYIWALHCDIKSILPFPVPTHLMTEQLVEPSATTSKVSVD
jgi:hypothetical protein